MKKIVSITLFVVLPLIAAAQVEKRVEVTKDYVPTVAGAAKMAVAPDMTDTVVMRPDIDYSITPMSMASTFSSTLIRPATMTYWEFNRPKPFYMKFGAGWPGNTVADIYATTQNPGTGYLTAYFNHEGRFQAHGEEVAPRDFRDITTNSARMYNRVGVAAGKYLGRHILEGEVSYENRRFHRYDHNLIYVAQGQDVVEEEYPAKTMYNEFGVLVRLGDDFTDLTRTNFNIALRGTLFNDGSDLPEGRFNARQTHLGADFALARQFGHHTFRFDAMYEHGSGARSISDYRQDIFKAGLRYGYSGSKIDFEVGADYYYDEIAGFEQYDRIIENNGYYDYLNNYYSGNSTIRESVSLGHSTDHYVTPALKFHWKLKPNFRIFAEVDGSLRDNSLRSLTRQNPYVSPAIWTDDFLKPNGRWLGWEGKSTVEYNFRVGIRGGMGNGKFAYRLYGGYSVIDNYVFWTVQRGVLDNLPLVFVPQQGRMDIGSINAELEYRPVGGLILDAQVHGYFYEDNVVCEKGIPPFKAAVGARYAIRKVSFGVRAEMQGKRSWTIYESDTSLSFVNDGMGVSTFEVPFTVDLSANVDWRVSKRVSIFGEVRNIANARLYQYPFYPEYGINFTAGLKLTF